MANDTKEHNHSSIPAAYKAQLNHYLQFIRLEKGLSSHSIQSYEHDLKRYFQFLIHHAKVHDIAGVTMNHIESFLHYLIDESLLSSSSLARNISSIRGFHEFSIVENFSQANPAELIELPKKAKKLPEVLDPNEISELLESPNIKTPAGIRDRAILETLYGTGMRVSELTDLESDRLFFEIGFIRVIGKGQKERLVPVGEMAKNALEHYIEEVRPLFFNPKKVNKAKNKVFLNQRGGALSRMSVWNIVQKAARDANITKSVYPHIFRHSFATHLLEGGADLRAVQEMLGHSSIVTTEIYTHVDRSLLRDTHIQFHPRG